MYVNVSREENHKQNKAARAAEVTVEKVRRSRPIHGHSPIRYTVRAGVRDTLTERTSVLSKRNAKSLKMVASVK